MIDLKQCVQTDVSRLARSYKFIDKSRIPDGGLREISRIFEENANLSLTFSSRSPLTVMETIIVALLVLGGFDSEVAAVLNISPNTLRGYVEKIKIKMGVDKKTEALLKALRNGILRFIYN